MTNREGTPAAEYLAKVDADPRRAAALQRARESAASGMKQSANFKCVECGWVGAIDPKKPTCPNCVTDEGTLIVSVRIPHDK